MAGTIVGMGLSPTAQAIGGLLPPGRKVLMTNPLGFNGERCDPVTGGYHLGNGYRMYNPRFMRFHGADSMSPFGKGGLNSYAYCLGDPINKRDPSGHFALIDNLIGAVVGFVVGLISQGIQTLMDPSHEIDWAQIGIDAAVGFLTSGFGVGSSVLLETVVGGVVDFGANFALNVGRGQSLKEAAKSAGISAGVGVLVGVGGAVAKSGARQTKRGMQSLAKIKPIKMSGGAGSADVNQSFGPLRLRGGGDVPNSLNDLPNEIIHNIARNLDERDMANFAMVSRRMRSNVDAIRSTLGRPAITIGEQAANSANLRRIGAIHRADLAEGSVFQHRATLPRTARDLAPYQPPRGEIRNLHMVELEQHNRTYNYLNANNDPWVWGYLEMF